MRNLESQLFGSGSVRTRLATTNNRGTSDALASLLGTTLCPILHKRVIHAVDILLSFVRVSCSRLFSFCQCSGSCAKSRRIGVGGCPLIQAGMSMYGMQNDAKQLWDLLRVLLF